MATIVSYKLDQHLASLINILVLKCRLSVIFLAFEVLFVMFCIGMACIILFTMFCYIPVVATIEYIAATGKGASENDLRTLPKFHYTHINPPGTLDDVEKKDVELAIESDSSFSRPKLVLHLEDSVSIHNLFNLYIYIHTRSSTNGC